MILKLSKKVLKCYLFYDKVIVRLILITLLLLRQLHLVSFAYLHGLLVPNRVQFSQNAKFRQDLTC